MSESHGHREPPPSILRQGTGWRRLIGCLNLQVIFRKRATNYRALLRKMTYEHKASYESSSPCTQSRTHTCAQTVDKNCTMMQRNRSSAVLFSQMIPIIMFRKLYITMFAQKSPTVYFHKRAPDSVTVRWSAPLPISQMRGSPIFLNMRHEPCISADSDESYTISEVPQQLEAASAET